MILLCVYLEGVWEPQGGCLFLVFKYRITQILYMPLINTSYTIPRYFDVAVFPSHFMRFFKEVSA